MRFLILTGLSGAGKTQAVRCLEDIGYYCMDNLPPQLIPKFADICYQTDGKIDKIAIVVDIRGGKFFDDLFKSLKDLGAMGYQYEIVFLDAEDEVLIKRFKETRRNHPLAANGRIISGIQEERRRLTEVKSKADFIIDTSKLTSRQLREELTKVIGDREDLNRLLINVMSFGFKYGIPIDADLVFDVRFLPNPYYIPELRRLTGNEDHIRHYVMSWEESELFLKKVNDLLEFLIPFYIKEGKAQLVVAIGCTGGMHRSVVIANEIHEYLKKKNNLSIVSHRDIARDNVEDHK